MFGLVIIYLLIASLFYYILEFLVEFSCRYRKNRGLQENRPPEFLMIIVAALWIPMLVDLMRFAKAIMQHPEPDPDFYVKVPLVIRLFF